MGIKTCSGLIFFTMLIVCSNCEQNKDNQYPGFIKSHELVDKYDKAKWILYNLNTFETEINYFICIDPETEKKVKNLYYQTRDEYEKRGLELNKDEEKVKEIFGQSNIIRYIECDLEWFAYDSTRVINGDEVRLVFFPKHPKDKSKYLQKFANNHYYEVIFQKDSIIGIGGDDYFEISYLYNKEIEELYINQIRNSKINTNKWILNYIEKLEK